MCSIDVEVIYLHDYISGLEMNVEYRKASKTDLGRCIEIRGLTQDNALNRSQLAAIGVTNSSWSPLIENGTFVGNVAVIDGSLIGFCFGDAHSGEILVLAILSGYEGYGVGKQLLNLTCSDLFSKGHAELWLAASATPVVRAHGFYRKLGWRPTNRFDDNGDELLRYTKI